MQSFEAVIISSGAEQPRAVYPGAASCEVKVEKKNVSKGSLEIVKIVARKSMLR